MNHCALSSPAIIVCYTVDTVFNGKYFLYFNDLFLRDCRMSKSLDLPIIVCLFQIWFMYPVNTWQCWNILDLGCLCYCVLQKSYQQRYTQCWQDHGICRYRWHVALLHRRLARPQSVSAVHESRTRGLKHDQTNLATDISNFQTRTNSQGFRDFMLLV